MFVLEHDLQRYAFARGCGIDGWGQVQAGGLSGAKQLTWVFHRRAVDRRVPRFDQALHSCARYILLRCRRREKTVKPLAAVLRRNAIGQAKTLFENHAHACLACRIGNKSKSTLLPGLRKPAPARCCAGFFRTKIVGKLDHRAKNASVPLAQSSCITCHSVASVKSGGTDGHHPVELETSRKSNAASIERLDCARLCMVAVRGLPR